MADNINFDYDADEVINGFKSKFKWPKADEIEVVISPGKMPLRILLSVLCTAVFGGVTYYIMLPAMNFKSTEFYEFLILIIAAFIVFFALFCKAHKKVERKEYVKKKSVIPAIAIGVILIVMLIGYLSGAAIFRAKAYSNLMPF